MLALGMLLRILLKVALVAETSAGSGENVSVELPRLATLMPDLGSTELPLSAENVVAPRKRAESGFQRVSLLAGAHNASDATAWPPSTLNIRARKNAAEARSNDGIKRLQDTSAITTSTLRNIEGASENTNHTNKQPSEVWRITSPNERSHIKSGNVSPCGNDDYERPDLMASALNGWLPSGKHPAALETLADSCFARKGPHLATCSMLRQAPPVTCLGAPLASYAERPIVRSAEDLLAYVYAFAPLENGTQPLCPVIGGVIMRTTYGAGASTHLTHNFGDDGIGWDERQHDGVYTSHYNYYYGPGVYFSHVDAMFSPPKATVSGQPLWFNWQVMFYTQIIVTNPIYRFQVPDHPAKLSSVDIDRKQLVPAATVRWVSSGIPDEVTEIWMGLQAAELAERYLLKAGVLVDPKKDLLKGTLLPNSSRGTISEVVVRVPKKLLDRISEHSRTAIVFISLVVINKFNIRGKPSAPMNFTITLPPSTVRGPDFHKPAGSPSCGPAASLWTVLFATATVLAFVL